MLIIGCGFHPRYQQIAMAEETTGELLLERRLDHESGEAHTFYRSLQGPVHEFRPQDPWLSAQQGITMGRTKRAQVAQNGRGPAASSDPSTPFRCAVPRIVQREEDSSDPLPFLGLVLALPSDGQEYGSKTSQWF